MKALLEIIGAVVVATLILALPILSYVSFLYSWNDFLQWLIIIGLAVDFLYVLSKLIMEV